MKNWEKNRADRYRVNEDYRKKHLERSKRTWERLKKDKLYVKIKNVGGLIYMRREGIENYLNKIAKLEKDLIRLVKYKEKLLEKRRMRDQIKIRE